MLNMLARPHQGQLIFYRRICGLLCAVFLVIGLFGCSSPTITLDLLRALNSHARVEQSCHRVIGVDGELHFGVHKADENQIIMEDTPERIIEAVQTADVITHYAPDSPACRAKSRVQLGVIWTRAAPTHELPELHLSPTMREALESSLTQASRAEPDSKIFFGQLTTWRDPRLTMQQAETITHTVRQALRGHVNDLIKYGPLGHDFAEANQKFRKQNAPTTVEPIDTPQAQFAGGALAEIGPAVVPGGALVTQALIDQGVLPRGTREAQAGKAATDIVVGAAQVFIGADGAIIGGGMSLTGGGAVAGVPLCMGSLALAVNGAATAWNGAKSLTIVLCRWEDEPAAGASAPAEPAPAAKPAQAPPAAPPAAPPRTTTTTPVKGAPAQSTPAVKPKASDASGTGPAAKKPARLPPKGTPERRAIETARDKGVKAKKAQELADIRAGGKGSGVWTEKELATIRKTGKFPEDAQWHHDPTVANRPDLAADPSIVRPVRGGIKGHLEAHGGDFRKP